MNMITVIVLVLTEMVFPGLLTLVDALGLQVMSVRQTAICWSTDFHLGLTGVPLAIHRQ